MITKTNINAEAGKHDLFITREFDFPREMLFEAFADPAMMEQFYAPFDYTLHFHHHDYRTGGSYSWSNKNKEGKTLCTFKGVIHELTAPERIIQTAEFMELPERGNVILEIITFEDLGAGRSKIIIHEVCPSAMIRDTIVNSGMTDGISDIFDKLERLLKK